MDEITLARCNQLAKVMKALGHPTRVFIVLELRKGPKCVCELTDLVGVDTSTVSKHLSVLKNAGLVKAEKKGLMVYYSLVSLCVFNFFACVEELTKRELAEKGKVLSDNVE